MRISDIITSLLLVLFAAYVVVGALHLSYMQGGVPGPGFAPFWIGVALGLAAAINLVSAWAAQEKPAPLMETGAIPRLALLSLFTVAWVASMPYLGMVVSLALFMGLTSWLLGVRRWSVLLALMILVPLGFYLVFERWLGVPLPRGILL